MQIPNEDKATGQNDGYNGGNGGNGGQGETSLFDILMTSQTGKKPIEALNAIDKLLTELMQSPAMKACGMNFLIVDQPPLRVPVIALYMPIGGKYSNGVVTYNVIPKAMFNDDTKLKPKGTTVQGTHGPIPVTEFPNMNAVADGTLVTTVHAAIAQVCNVPAETVKTVNSAMLIDSIDKLTDHPELILPLQDTAHMMLKYSTEPERYALRKRHLTGYELNARFDIQPGRTRTNVLGQPVASDFEITTALRKSGESKAVSMHNEQSAIVLSRTVGIIDLIRTPTGVPVNGQPQPGFTANLILTDIGSGLGQGNTTETLETTILSLLNVSMLAVNRGWAPLLSDPEKSGLGALGMIYDPLTGGVPAKPTFLNIAKVGAARTKQDITSAETVMNTFILPNAMISIDLEPCSRLYGYHRILVDSMMNNDNGMQARTLLNAAVGRLAGADFNSKHSPVLAMKVLPHAVYLNGSSDYQDSRSLTFLKTIAQANGDVSPCDDYTIATNFSNPTSHEGMHRYWQWMQVVHPNVEYDNLRYRVTINPAWLSDVMSHIAGNSVSFTYEGLNYGTSAIQVFDPSVLNNLSMPTGFFAAAGNGNTSGQFNVSNFGTSYFTPGM